jgi:DNA processing protein
LLGYGSRTITPLLEKFPSAKAVYDADYESLKNAGVLTPKQLSEAKNKDMSSAVTIAERCEKLKIRTMTPDDDIYPRRLRNIVDYPAVIYYVGEFPNVDDNVLITVIGTRQATPRGKAISAALGYSLAQNGAILVSGGAVGIDISSHIGALKAGGKSILVLACSINSRYNIDYVQVRREIARSGAIITEYPPDTEPSKRTFPIRNRLMSAISLGVAVIEAPERSGSLITVSHALEQGKDIFAVPGDIMSEMSTGANRIIRDGAQPIESVNDILSEYIYKYPHRINMPEKKSLAAFARQIDVRKLEPYNQANQSRSSSSIRGGGGTGGASAANVSVRSVSIVKAQGSKGEKGEKSEKSAKIRDRSKPAAPIKPSEQIVLPEDISEQAAQVFRAIADGAGKPNEITQATNLPVQAVLSSITELEISDLIETDGKGRYAAKI